MLNCKENYRNESVLLFIITKFQPIIKKYSRKLDYEEAESDLIIFLIELIKKLPDTNNESILINYIARSIKNEYIRLNKKQEQIRQKEILTDFGDFKSLYSKNIDIDLNIDIKDSMKLLSQRQLTVIKYRFFLGYSSSKTAEILKVSRQAIFKTEKRALALLKNHLI